MIKVTKEKDGVYFTLTAKLDRDDVFELMQDLQKWLYNGEQKYTSPSGFNFHNKEHYEAYLQGQSKLALSKDIQRDIEERFGDKYYVTKEGNAIKREKYDIVPSEIELQELKLKKQNGKKGI